MEGESPPEEWTLAVMSDWFPTTPLFGGTLLDWPYAVVSGIAELRSFAQAREAVRQAKSLDDAPDGPMVDWVFKVQKELLRRRAEG